MRLFAIDEIEENITQPGYSTPLTLAFLKANLFLVLDTKHFDDDFKDRLLASIEDLDAQTDGLLIESENFQALNPLQARYREHVKTIAIDPPYNRLSDNFPYKDNFRHSSWLSMVKDRVNLERVMNSIKNGLGMQKTEIAKQPSRPWNPHSYAIFVQVHNTL